jgi:hypothetical protein
MRFIGWRCLVTCFVAIAAMVFTSGGAGAAAPKWTVVSTHNSSTTQKNAMDGVSCVSSTFCFAVGGYYTGTSPVIKHAQTQKWNGSHWSTVAVPNKTGSTVVSNFLMGISCVKTNFCMAAGYYTQNGGRHDGSLIERWNGTSWKIVSSPNVASVSNDLAAVSCFSTTFCMAVGDTINGSFLTQTTAEKWNGSKWSVVKPKNVSTTHDQFLWGASCSTATFCMAVGYFDTASGEYGLTEKWSTSAWSVVSSPHHSGGPANPVNDLWSVSCVKNTTHFCLAAGHYVNASFFKQTLVEKFNGSKWSMLTSPDKSTTDDDAWYSGVSCSATNFCMDTTFTSPNGSSEQTNILRWNGTTVSIKTSANTSSAQDNRLQAASCVSSAFCMAVGQYTPTTISQNLAEVWK